MSQLLYTDTQLQAGDAVILSVKNLGTAFETESGRLRALDDVGFSLQREQTLGIVGESGCGKSVTALSIMRLLPKPAGVIESGQVLLDDIDLIKLSPEEMHTVRGRRMAMIFQEPMTALNPVQRIGKQMKEVFQLHFAGMSSEDIHGAVCDLLHQVGIPEPETRMGEYPHQMSGGMRQRVMIAMALAAKPQVLIADEPTTALDVTIQAQILELMRQLQRRTGMSIIFITHDLGVIAEICDEVVVMYAGRIAETAPVADLFSAPRHPYTQGLLRSIPKLEARPKIKLEIIEGMVPGLADMPTGCRFRNRCPHAMEVCALETPPLKPVGANHFTSCYLY